MGGGGGVLSYTLYRNVPPNNGVGFLMCSVHKKGIIFGTVILRYSLDRVTKLQYPLG